MADIDWIAADWGTSNLRVWALGAGGIIATAQSDDGMGKLAPDQFEAALLRLIGPWLVADRVMRVIACGMVGARQGWVEAPYRSTPCTPTDPAARIIAPSTDPRIRVEILPGLSQSTPADVMRGEETQIAGALALHPNFDGVICLPGTHSKWAHISAGEVVSFQTAMTGELFALLSGQSVLRHGMSGAEGWDDAEFDAALSETLSRPERIGTRLFSLRAQGLLAGLQPAAARSRLSGMLIGLELAATKAYWLGQPITLIGTASLAQSYARALRAQGATPRLLDATDCTLAGLISAWKG